MLYQHNRLAATATNNVGYNSSDNAKGYSNAHDYNGYSNDRDNYGKDRQPDKRDRCDDKGHNGRGN